MKNSLKVLILGLFFFACGNPCDDIDCGPNGTCVEESESCLCDQYYEGTRCETEVRAKFVGAWSGTGTCGPSTFPLDVNISQALNVNEITINSDDILQNYIMFGMLDENNDIVIPTFMVPFSTNSYDGKIVTLSENSIEMTLNAIVNGDLFTCEYTLSK